MCYGKALAAVSEESPLKWLEATFKILWSVMKSHGRWIDGRVLHPPGRDILMSVDEFLASCTEECREADQFSPLKEEDVVRIGFGVEEMSGGGGGPWPDPEA